MVKPAKVGQEVQYRTENLFMVTPAVRSAPRISFQEALNAGAKTCGGTIRIMPLGDSITTGSASGVSPDEESYWISYRKDLWESLNAAGYDVDFVGSQVSGDAHPGFDPDNEGHPGWRDDHVAASIYDWLVSTPADVVLLHIGTNGVEPSPDEVETILDEIDRYSVDTWVILARIINRVPYNATTTEFNDNVEAMAEARTGDKILLVDMENGAGINYELYHAVDNPDGEMWDYLHPYANGYVKMASVWKTALDQVLSVCAADDSYSVNEDSSATTFTVLSNDAGQSLSITGVGAGSAGGTITTNGSTVSYAPAGNFSGEERFTYSIQNGSTGGTDMATVTVNVQPINDPPAANNDSFTVAENSTTALDVLSNDTSHPDDGETLTILQVTQGSSGGGVVTDGSTIDYTPVTNFHGTETFSYTINDGTPGSSDSATVTVTVTEVNDPPVASPDSKSTGEDQPLTFPASDLTANDSPGPNESGQELDVTGVIQTGQTHGSVALAGGDVTYTPDPDFNGSASFQYTVCDSGSPVECDTGSVTVTVSPSPDAPQVSSPGSQSSAEGQTISLQIDASDPDGDNLIYSAGGLPTSLVIDPDTGEISGEISYSAANGSSYTVQVNVSDGMFDETTSFSWSVSNTNRSPELAPTADQTDGEGDEISFQLTASDPDGDSLSYSADGLPPGLGINSSTGKISGVISHAAADSSPYSVEVTVSDGDLVDSHSFTWVVSNTNRSPILVDPGNQTDTEGEVVMLPIGASDPDGDDFSFAAAGLPLGLSIDPGTGVISGTLSFEAALALPYTVHITATDTGSPILDDSISFLWSVENFNRRPELNQLEMQENAEGEMVSVAIHASDPDEDPLTYSAAGLPSGLSMDPDTGEVGGVIDYTAAGGSPFQVTVNVSDGQAEDNQSFTWVVSNTNRPPTVKDPGDQHHQAGEMVSLQIQASDPDNDPLSFIVKELPPGLELNPNTGRISGQLGADSVGLHTVLVTVSEIGSPAGAGVMIQFYWTISEPVLVKNLLFIPLLKAP